LIDIQLDPVPNQTVGIRLEDELYSLTIKETAGVMSVDIKRADVYILRGVRIVAGTPLLPYRYLEIGNFVLLTENEELPEYPLFGVSQSLVYVTAAEIEALRNE